MTNVVGFPPSSEEPWVTRRQLAERMQVCERTVDNWVREGIPSETWGMRARRFQVSRAVAWARARERKAA